MTLCDVRCIDVIQKGKWSKRRGENTSGDPTRVAARDGRSTRSPRSNGFPSGSSQDRFAIVLAAAGPNVDPTWNNTTRTIARGDQLHRCHRCHPWQPCLWPRGGSRWCLLSGTRGLHRTLLGQTCLQGPHKAVESFTNNFRRPRCVRNSR